MAKERTAVAPVRTPQVRDRCIAMMNEAMDEVGLVGQARRCLEGHFDDVSCALTTFSDPEPPLDPDSAYSIQKPFDAVGAEEL